MLWGVLSQCCQNWRAWRSRGKRASRQKCPKILRTDPLQVPKVPAASLPERPRAVGARLGSSRGRPQFWDDALLFWSPAAGPSRAPFPCSFKQQNLEQRQADVEYELRCLLNKPGKAAPRLSLPPLLPWGFTSGIPSPSSEFPSSFSRVIACSSSGFGSAEKDWTEEDRVREQVLMQELVTIIEQRNAIVNCLDEDRQR